MDYDAICAKIMEAFERNPVEACVLTLAHDRIDKEFALSIPFARQLAGGKMGEWVLEHADTLQQEIDAYEKEHPSHEE